MPRQCMQAVLPLLFSLRRPNTVFFPQWLLLVCLSCFCCVFISSIPHFVGFFLPQTHCLSPSPVFSPCHLKCSGLACNHSTASFRSRCLPRDCFRIPEILWGHLSLVYWCDQEALLFPFSLQNCKQFCAFCTLLKRTSVQEPKCQPLAFAPGLKG